MTTAFTGSVAEAVAAAVRCCPAVAGLHGGPHGEVATYLPGRRITGVRVGDTGVVVHVVGRCPATAAEITAQVRAAVAGVAAGLPVALTVEDLAVDPTAGREAPWTSP